MVGKSFIASALGDHACKRGMTVRYAKTSVLISELLAAKADGSYTKVAAALARLDLLIIDEWLREPLHCSASGGTIRLPLLFPS